MALRAGDNTVLIKVCNALGGFSFGMRVISAETADLSVQGGKGADLVEGVAQAQGDACLGTHPA